MKYQVIYADPPWKYTGKYSTGGVGRRTGALGASDHYPTMNHEDIQSLPVSSLAHNNAALFLWATPPLLLEALETIKAWGFVYKTIAFTWVKLEGGHGGPFFGVGSYTKSNCELCLLGTRGKVGYLGDSLQKLIVQSKTESQVITTTRKNNRSWTFHSMKPHEAYKRIERLFGDVPRIELFARNRRPGWYALGHGIDGLDIREAIERINK